MTTIRKLIPEIIQAPVSHEILPFTIVDTFKSGVSTPNISHREIFKSPSSSTTITNFLGGQEGQTIKILGNGNLTVSNNANIKTNTGANKVLVANKVYTFTLIANVWYENE